MKNFLTLIAVSLAFAACASNPKMTDVKQAEPAKEAAPIAQTAADTPKVATVSQADIDAQKLAAEKMAAEKTAAALRALQKESVYFDFDKSNIKPQYNDVLQHHAEWMKNHENDQVTLEGNADERGSSEYNMALGSRRATSVHRALVMLGISEQRIKDVSNGEEKPKASCHAEKCWHENRRVDFVHSSNQ